WIFFPRSVEFYLSSDGETWEMAGRRENAAEPDREPEARRIGVAVDGKAARYVRVVARGVDPLPDWHAGAGEPGWLFADEIIVEA
ncbi:MAG: beta-N-acetylhexosaminidase, partial [Gemmatimonadota bacterium]|nr:beta-N-acetylhexosaminidase [Gemmatimonadota bacterium]